MNGYKLLPQFDGFPVIILRKKDQVRIPSVENNIDFQQYEKWLEEGNTPEPADPLPILPLQCTKRQGEHALLTLPVMLGDARLSALHWVEAAIAQEPDPIKQRRMLSDFNAAVWEEGNPLLGDMWAALEPLILGEKPQSLRAVFELALMF